MARLTARNYNGFCKRFSYTIADYDIGLRLHPRRKTVQADAAITLVPDQDSRQLCFCLAENCQILRFDYLGIPLPYKLSHAGWELNLLTAQLPLRPSAGEPITVNIAYTINLPDQQNSLELAPKAHWYPFSPRPQKYACTLRINADGATRALGPGEITKEALTGTRMYTKFEAKKPFRGIHAFIGQFLKTARASQPPLLVAYPRKLLNQAKAIGNYCEELLAFLSETLGPAPFPALTFILSDDAQPYSHSSYFLSSISLGALTRLKEDSPGKDWYSHQYMIIAENLAKHWLKEPLAISHPRDRWYLAGLARYISWLAVEAKYGKARRQKYMDLARQRLLKAPKFSFQATAVCGKQLPEPVIDRAAWLLHHSHCQSQAEFLPVLSGLLSRWGDAAPSTEAFFLALSDALGCGLCLQYKNLFQQTLEIEALAPECIQDESGCWQLTFKLKNSGRLSWPYPVEIEVIQANGARVRHCLPIQKAPYCLELPAPARCLRLDPDGTLLNWAKTREYELA